MTAVADQGLKVELKNLQPHHVASIRMATERLRVHRTIAIIHELVMDVVGAQGLAPAGPLFARFHHLGLRVDLEAGLLLSQPIDPVEAIKARTLPGGAALYVLHMGDSESLAKARMRLAGHGASYGYRPAGALWECYLVDARDTGDPSEWRTELYLPVHEVHPATPR